jgi:hypothetical protein
MAIDIDYSVVADCHPSDIWLTIEDLRRWHQFDPDGIESVHWVAGMPWTKGARFEIKLHKPISISLMPEIIEVEKPVLIHWRAQGGGITGEQWFIFRLLPNDMTEMRTLQHYAGLPLKLLGPKAKTAIEDGVHHLFAVIKREAEENARLSNWIPPVP